MSTKINNYGKMKALFFAVLIIFGLFFTIISITAEDQLKPVPERVLSVTFDITSKMISVCDTCELSPFIDKVTVRSVIEKPWVMHTSEIPPFIATAINYIEVFDANGQSIGRYEFPNLYEDYEEEFIYPIKKREFFIPYTGKEKTVRIVYENVVLKTVTLSQPSCNRNGRCETGENNFVCSQDCSLGNPNDNFCQPEVKGCDFDCGYADVDCTDKELCGDGQLDGYESGIDCGGICERNCEIGDIRSMLRGYDVHRYSSYDLTTFLNQFSFV